MTTDPLTGHDGPYAAPIRLRGGTVLADWIDYNGHMNVAYYTLAVDQVLDRFLEDELGLGESHAKATGHGPYALQSHYTYLGELREGQGFDVSVQLLDHDQKRMHLLVGLHEAQTDRLAATCETLIMNVDHAALKGAAYPDWAQARLAQLARDHGDLPRPAQIGAPIGIRRR